MKRLRYVAGVVLVLTGCSAADYSQPTLTAAPETKLSSYVPGEFIVTAAPAANIDQVRLIYAAFGVKEIRDLGRGRFLLRLEHDPGLDRVRSAGVQSGMITAVQPNYVYRTQ